MKGLVKRLGGWEKISDNDMRDAVRITHVLTGAADWRWEKLNRFIRSKELTENFFAFSWALANIQQSLMPLTFWFERNPHIRKYLATTIILDRLLGWLISGLVTLLFSMIRSDDGDERNTLEVASDRLGLMRHDPRNTSNREAVMDDTGTRRLNFNPSIKQADILGARLADHGLNFIGIGIPYEDKYGVIHPSYSASTRRTAMDEVTSFTANKLAPNQADIYRIMSGRGYSGEIIKTAGDAVLYGISSPGAISISNIIKNWDSDNPLASAVEAVAVLAGATQSIRKPATYNSAIYEFNQVRRLQNSNGLDKSQKAELKRLFPYINSKDDILANISEIKSLEATLNSSKANGSDTRQLEAEIEQKKQSVLDRIAKR